MKVKSLAGIACFGLIVLALCGTAGAQAAFPYSDGFESGVLGPEWSIVPDANGQIRVTTSYGPHGGDYHVAMDCLVSGTYAYNMLDLAIDLSGQSQVELSYWYKEFGDENHAEDGCFISDDGVNFYQVLSHNDGPSDWTMFTVDIDQAAALLGLSLNGSFVIRFSHSDNSPLTSDGICIDDVKVDGASGPALTCDTASISAAAGGQAFFMLDAGVPNAGCEYALLGTASGTTPGQLLPGGGVLPLNPGLFMQCVRAHMNGSYLIDFHGYLDASGFAIAELNTNGPLAPILAGRHLDFAFTTVGPFDFQSETVGIDILP